TSLATVSGTGRVSSSLGKDLSAINFLLRMYWADHFRDQRNNKGIRYVEYFLEKIKYQSVTGRYGRDYGPILQLASLRGHEFIVQMLLEKGADVHAQGGEYGNALQAASWQGHDQVVQMLLDKGADVNAQGEEYSNALQAASLQGHTQVVQTLLDKGAEVNAQEGVDGNALQAALWQGHDQVVQMLLDKGAM
ncbi:MAG: hypothetical protein Q9228_006229, partial [Teloschistes exilis]